MYRTLKRILLFTIACTLAGWLSCEIVAAKEQASSVDGLLTVELNRRDGVYEEGERLAIRVTPHYDLHVYVLYHQADGQAVMLYPSFASPRSRLLEERTVVVDGTREGIPLLVRASSKRDSLQVLVVSRDVDELDRQIPYDFTGDAKPGYPAMPTSDVDALGRRLVEDQVLLDNVVLPIQVVD